MRDTNEEQERLISTIKAKIKTALVEFSVKNDFHEIVYALHEAAADVCGSGDSERAFLEESFAEVFEHYRPA